MSTADERRVAQLKNETEGTEGNSGTSKAKKTTRAITKKKDIVAPVSANQMQEQMQTQQKAIAQAGYLKGREEAQTLEKARQLGFIEEYTEISQNSTANLVSGLLNAARMSQDEVIESFLLEAESVEIPLLEAEGKPTQFTAIGLFG